MGEYDFNWKMTRPLAKKLVLRQFMHYYMVKYFLKYFLVEESLFAIMILVNFRSVQFFWGMSVGGIFATLYILYERFYQRMLPQKPYFSDYHAHFDDTGFEVEGKTYKRPYTYDQIDKLIVKKDCLIFVTPYEGMILPVSVFSSMEEKKAFLENLQVVLKKQV